ncbi:MAG TPA: transposase, partial [Nitrososphaera sp.]|nr:transposase [Nitrososphaera sp.]
MSIGTTYRTYTFRLYPNHQQEFKLVDTIRANCAVYNELLPLVRKGVFSRNELNYALTELKEEQQWLRAYHSKMLQMISTRLAASVKSLNEKKKRGYMVGEIHHSPSEQFSSFTYNQSGFKIEKHGDTNLLWLSKIGYMEIRLHMNIDRIKQVTVIQRNKKWYALLVCIFSRPITMFINPTKSIGIDVGIKKFCHDSQNRAIENPLYLSNKLRRLKRSSRTLSHRLKNSRNMRKAKSRLQILHARIRNKRRD